MPKQLAKLLRKPAGRSEHSFDRSYLLSRLIGIYTRVWQNAKYLLFQEKCRICMRYIHPQIPHMDWHAYHPPAKYCFKNRELILDSLCELCWPLLDNDKPECREHEMILAGGKNQKLIIASATRFDGEIKKLIYKFKYDGDLLLGQDLAIFLLSAWQIIESVFDPRLTVLVPVPLHWGRAKERGFNQSEVLARHLSRYTKIEDINQISVQNKKDFKPTRIRQTATT